MSKADDDIPVSLTNAPSGYADWLAALKGRIRLSGALWTRVFMRRIGGVMWWS